MVDVAEKVRALMNEHESEFVETFKHLHRNPELSFQEYETTAFIKNYLQKLDIEILDVGLETGVVGLLKGSGDGPCIALRADIDGLPIQEESTCEFPSQRPGKMHATIHIRPLFSVQRRSLRRSAARSREASSSCSSQPRRSILAPNI